MRTTLSLDPDVAALISREVETTRKSLKSVVNEKLRRGFAVEAIENRKPSEHRLPPPLDLGQPKIPNFDNIAEILELIETADDSH